MQIQIFLIKSIIIISTLVFIIILSFAVLASMVILHGIGKSSSWGQRNPHLQGFQGLAAGGTWELCLIFAIFPIVKWNL